MNGELPDTVKSKIMSFEAIVGMSKDAYDRMKAEMEAKDLNRQKKEQIGALDTDEKTIWH